MQPHPPKLKEQLLKKLLMEGGPSVAELSEQSGVSKSTLWAWRRQHRRKASLASGGQLPATGQSTSNRDKLAALIATAAMNELERSAWCREHGLYVGQLDQWRQAFEAAELSDGANVRAQLQRERRKSQALQKELQRKERALAETAALLTLSKKAQAIWGMDADD